jgi:hypothetical protein
MNYVIPEEVIKRARQCLRGHACLHDPDYRLCGNTIYRDIRMIRLVCPQQVDCPFSKQIGQTAVCTCPVRQEIFRNYED